MGALTEREIFDCMDTNLGLAVQHCEDLARLPAKGETYIKFRENLKLIEGACRQASAWREDTRWLSHGMLMAEAHKRAGDWLRGSRDPMGTRVKLANGMTHPLFMKLADNLRAFRKIVEQLRTRRTHRTGIILPVALPGPHRDTRPSRVSLPEGMKQTKSGLIVPSGVAA